MNEPSAWERMLNKAERERDEARAEVVRVHREVWAATRDAAVMGYDGKTVIEMVRAALRDDAEVVR